VFGCSASKGAIPHPRFVQYTESIGLGSSSEKDYGGGVAPLVDTIFQQFFT